MQTVFVGEYIKRRRKELKLTQEEVCEGICDPTTLSRIENGRQTPSKTKINALLQRLGLPDSRYYAVASKNELEVEALKKEIVGCNITERAEEGFAKLEKLSRITAEDDLLTRQFILRSQILLGKMKGRYSLQEQLDLLMQAIHLTIPKFRLDEINQFLYTFDEVKIINQIALCYSDLEQRVTALSIYQQLLKYIRCHNQEVTITGNGLLPLVLHNYARELGLAKQYKECIQAAQEGQEVCIRYGHYQFLPGFIAIMAECYFFCGDAEKSKEYYLQAYYTYLSLKDKIGIEEVKEEAKKRLNLDFNQAL